MGVVTVVALAVAVATSDDTWVAFVAAADCGTLVVAAASEDACIVLVAVTA